MIPRPSCMCMLRRRRPHDASLSKSSRIPRCKICAPLGPSNGSPSNGQTLSKRVSGIPEKIKSPILEEKIEPNPESTSRMSGYKKCIAGSKYKNSTFKGISAKEAKKMSRKSILECDVTAYDLIKKVAKTPSVSEIDDSDIDDNLSDNAIAKINQTKRLSYENKSKPVSPANGTARHIANKKLSSKFKKSQSENCIYSETHSVMVGGQRIFTDNHKSKSPILAGNLNSGDELEDTNHELNDSKWRKMSISEESICIPDPDYDFSDDSDDSTVINSNCMDPKFTYSPPPIRKSFNEHQGLGCGSRELSKSMSSLQSDDTFVPSINANKPNSPKWISELQDCDNFEDDIRNSPTKAEESEEEVQYDELPASPCNTLSSKQDSKYESSSDCSSSGGTLSSDYRTWTSSSSNELKSILKNKKRRENAIKALQEASQVPEYLDDLKDSQKKKQVQFHSGFKFTAGNGENGGTISNNKDKLNSMSEKLATVINDTYETVSEAKSDNVLHDYDNPKFDSSRGK